MENTHERVLHFINLIKGHKNEDGNDAHEVLEQVYQRGNCYMFAKTLQFVFPEAQIMTTRYFGVHVVAKIDDILYDIRGKLPEYEHEYYIPITKEQEKVAMTWCYSHQIQSCYGLHDSNGERIGKIESLEFDPTRNSWKIPNKEEQEKHFDDLMVV